LYQFKRVVYEPVFYYDGPMFTAEIERLVDLTDTELHARVRSLELEHRTVQACLAAALAVADARQLNAVVDGHLTMRSYLRAELNYSTAEASRWLQIASMLNAHPAVGDAWINGHIGSPQAVTFARTYANRRVRDRLGEFVPILLDHAEQLPHSDFAACVDKYVALADPDGAHNDRDDAIRNRRAHVSEVGGVLAANVFGGDPLTAVEMVDIHRQFIDAEYQTDVAARKAMFGDDAENHDLDRTHTQRCFDAFIKIFRSANTDIVGQPANTIVNIVTDAGTFARTLRDAGLAPDTINGRPVDPFTGLPDPLRLIDDLVGAPGELRDRRCETASGIQLHPHDVLRAALAGHVRRVVLDSNGVIVNMGRLSRLYTGSARTAAKLLIHHCQRPGCELPTDFSQIDHNTEWNEHGSTDQTNAGVICGPDNREKHRQKWKRQRATNAHQYTIRADGTIMLPVGARTPDFSDADDTAELDHLARQPDAS
jgi:Domain of unknown function (DUF222)